MDALQVLRERGFLKALTHEEELGLQLAKEPTTFYVGIDPTGYSMHIGHLVPILASIHLGRAGHCPIFVLGGGTALIGDPSGKIEMRSLQTKDQINEQAQVIGDQLKGLVTSMDVQNFKVVNNADWLKDLNYIDFLRDIGRHFSVNRMLSFETYKKRLETGLSFIEFNYQLLQSYDFLELFKEHNCLLQLGGDDQWGNIVAGCGLIRRVTGAEAYGMTFNLVTRSDGKKMGKTEKGAIFINPKLTSPYDMYQYWRNVSDEDVRKFLSLYTFLPIEEVGALTREGGSALNRAKEVLAFEVTQLIHGKMAAEGVQAMAKSLFGNTGGETNAPEVLLSRKNVEPQMTIVDFCVIIGLCSSKGEAYRIIEGGGLYLDGRRVGDTSPEALAKVVTQDSVLVRQGKKKYIKVILSP